MIYIAICDDDPKEVSFLRIRVENWLKGHNVIATITIYTQSRMLQYDIEEGKYYDLILSDIEMPYVSGMELAAFITRCLPNTKIIFITSHLKYALDAYELAIFRYIPKKELDNRLPLALKDAVAMIILQADKFYAIEMPTRVEKIPYKDIVCIHREGKNSIISLIGDKETKVRKSLSQVYEELKSEDFIYIG